MKFGLSVFLVGIAGLGSGCLSTATFYSEPPRARVTMDDRKILGETPLQVEEQVYLWTEHTITIEKDGYKPQTIRLQTELYNTRSALLCICSLTALWPLAMTSDFVTSEFNVNLEPVATLSSSDLSPTPKIQFSGLNTAP